MTLVLWSLLWTIALMVTRAPVSVLNLSMLSLAFALFAECVAHG